MAIGNCDNCHRENIPVSHLTGIYCGDTTQCFICQGDEDSDPYGEVQAAWRTELQRLFGKADEFALAEAIYSFSEAFNDGLSPQQAYDDFNAWVEA